jgi:uncharacterized protein YcfL
MIPALHAWTRPRRGKLRAEVTSVTRSKLAWLTAILVLVLLLSGCRNETQNRIRRSIQDFTNTRMYITVFAYGGDVVFEGLVDGKVTRASATQADGGDPSTGTYIYWYDERGRYHQTDLPYLLTTYDRAGSEGE